MFHLLIAVFSLQLFAYETPKAVKEKYHYLYSLSNETNSDGSVSFHNGRLFRREGISVLSLKGDRFEMAYQHGKLLKNEIAQGALPQVAKMLESNVLNAFPSIPLVTDLIIKYFYSRYTDAIIDYSVSQQGGDIDEVLLEGYGLSEASGIPLDDVMHGAVGPESLQVVLGERLSGKSILPSSGMGSNCTDFAVDGSFTKNGNLLIGRNTDYPLNGSFDKYPTVLYYHPTDGTQKYMAVTSAGLHNAGVVGFNESGLFLGIHTIPTLDVSTKGVPVFMIGQEILRTARTFDEALAMFRVSRSASGWTYTLVSTKEHRMAAIEISNKEVAIREAKGESHVQTNHYMTLQMMDANLDLNFTVTEDTNARYRRTSDMINSLRGQIGVENVIQVLSDKWDPINKEVRGLGNVVNTHYTLTSVVLDPAAGLLYLANGRAPVPATSYVELPLIDKFDPGHMSDAYSTYDNSAYHQKYPQISQAEQKYIDAKVEFETYNQPAKAQEILLDAIRLDPLNAGYHFTRGIMALKANNFAAAQVAFQNCKKLKYQHYRFLGNYYLGRIYADQGDEDAAKKEFKAILSKADKLTEAKLIAATKSSLKKLSGMKPLKLSPATLVIFMPEADMIEY